VPQFACIVQAGQTAENRQPRLSDGLKLIAQETFGEPPGSVEIQWISVKQGFGFTAGKPSSSSLAVRSVPDGYPDDERFRLMTDISELWQEVTGCSANEIVVTVMDGPLPL
jgi:hypothetical protein